MRARLATFVCMILTSGCSVGVDLTVRNPEPFPQAVTVRVEKPGGGTDRTIVPGVVEAHAEQRLERFKVRKGGGYQLTSAIPGSATLLSKRREVSGSADPLQETVELRHQAGALVDDPRSMEEVTLAFRNGCPDAGAYPMELGSALRTKLKSLVVLDGGRHEIISLTAAQFGTGEVAAKDIVFPDTTAAGEMTISGGALAQLGKTIPLYSSFLFVTEEDALYRMAWLFEGFGRTALPSGDEDLLVAFDGLSDTVKSQISDILVGNSSANVYYLDQAYLARKARLSLQKGRVLKAGEEVRSGDVITSKGAYRFEPAGTVTKEYSNVVLNFYGDEISMNRIPKSAGGRSAVPVGSAPLMVEGVNFDLTGYPTGKRITILPEDLRVTPATVHTIQ